jgi:hypothetical protein
MTGSVAQVADPAADRRHDSSGPIDTGGAVSVLDHSAGRNVSADPARLDQRQVIELQRSAGNRAVSGLLQRAPAAAPVPPRKSGRRKGRTVPEEPLNVPDDLYNAIDNMPALINDIGQAIERGEDRTAALHFKSQVSGGSITAALLFSRDAVYFFNGSGNLQIVESNLVGDAVPADLAQLPAPKFRLPGEGQVLVSQPATGRTWRVFARLAKALSEDDDDAEGEMIGLDLRTTDSKPALPANLKSNELVVIVYEPFKFSFADPDVPRPGW